MKKVTTHEIHIIPDTIRSRNFCFVVLLSKIQRVKYTEP